MSTRFQTQKILSFESQKGKYDMEKERDKEMPKYLYQYHFKYIHICNYICLCVCTLRRLKLRLPRYGLSVCRNVLDLG
jgi:hypothetical protein